MVIKRLAVNVRTTNLFYVYTDFLGIYFTLLLSI